MKTAGFLLTLGLGMAAGAVVTSMLPPGSDVKRAVGTAADSIEQAAKNAVHSLEP